MFKLVDVSPAKFYGDQFPSWKVEPTGVEDLSRTRYYRHREDLRMGSSAPIHHGSGEQLLDPKIERGKRLYLTREEAEEDAARGNRSSKRSWAEFVNG